MPGATIGSVAESINALSVKFDTHIKLEEENQKKTAEMYKLTITGNGVPSLQERVRNLEAWVNGEKRFMWAFGLLLMADIVTRVAQLLGK
jgi:hypothetical protein